MQKIYYNGMIITMEETTYTEAVLTNGCMIEVVGSFDELKGKASAAELIDLKGKCMLPGFIDAHSHFSSYANTQLQISLTDVKSFDEIEKRIKLFLQENDIKEGQWILANGYDHNTLNERRHPTNTFLDKVAVNHPLIIQHQSGHCGVLNSKALELLGISINSVAPPGGVIGRADGELTGYLEEEAYIACIKKVPMAKIDEMIAAYEKVQNKYFSYGITTIQEGMMVTQMLPIYQGLLESNKLLIDVVGYSDLKSMAEITQAFPSAFKKYAKHFKIGGYKIFLDGSPQVRTAWLQTPYLNSNDYGYGTMSDEAVYLAVKKATAENIQIIAHCNGDAAIQQYIDATKRVSMENKAIKELRPVIIHSQLITKKQLGEAAALKMIPSFFLAHILHWGDVHIQNFGFERAKSISPAKSAIEAGVTFTIHQDTPVIEPDMLQSLQCAITRKTKDGIVLGAEERIDVLDALRAVNINAAYQYFEEDFKGSIKAGKLADLVILSENPLSVSKDQIKDILVLETIKNGESVFCLNKKCKD